VQSFPHRTVTNFKQINSIVHKLCQGNEEKNGELERTPDLDCKAKRENEICGRHIRSPGRKGSGAAALPATLGTCPLHAERDATSWPCQDEPQNTSHGGDEHPGSTL
jgi:hypothetical protein